MALTTEDMEFILKRMKELKDEFTKENEKMEDRLEKRITEFETNAHDMVASFRTETRQSIDNFTKETNTTLSKIVTQIECHDTAIDTLNGNFTDLDKRLLALENKDKKEKIKIENRKKTIKEFFKCMLDRVTIPVVVAIIILILSFFINGYILSKQIKQMENKITIEQKNEK